MVEEEAVPGSETRGGLTIVRPGPTTPKPGPASPIPPGLLLGYLDLAIRGTIEYERFEKVYVSPWWEVESVPENVHAWKRAVLERIPLHGAEHWGHLYLVIDSRTERRTVLSLFTKAPFEVVVPSKEAEAHLILREGEQHAELIAHPSRPERSEKLSHFAREIEERFRRQMD